MPCSNYRVNNECDVQHTVGIMVQIINVMCWHLGALRYEQNVSEAKSFVTLCDRHTKIPNGRPVPMHAYLYFIQLY